jgi:hypothetical protein
MLILLPVVVDGVVFGVVFGEVVALLPHPAKATSAISRIPAITSDIFTLIFRLLSFDFA